MKQGWTYKILGDIVDFSRGLTYSKRDEVESSVNIVLRSNNIDLSTGKLDLSELKYLRSDFDIPQDKILKKGSLFICMSNGSKIHLGKVAYIPENYGYAFGGFMGQITPHRDIDGRYLYYYFSSPAYKEYIKSLSAGANINNLKFKDLALFKVVYPSLYEQERIVERLDAAFAQIDELKNNAERQLAEARALFQSALTQAMQPKPGWQEKKLKEIADVKGGKRVPKGYKLQTTKTNHPYIRVADFNSHGSIDMSDIQFISNEIFEQIKNYTITDKDLYVSIAGTIGKTGIIPSELNGANLTENACKLVFKTEIVLRYVYLFTLSEIFKKQIEKATKQASQPKLALTRLAEVNISIPSISEQERIVEQLDSLSTRVRELEIINQRTNTECDALKQALLRQIFE